MTRSARLMLGALFALTLLLCTVLGHPHAAILAMPAGVAMTAAQKAAAAAAQNMAARSALVQTGLHFTKRLQSYSALGSAAALGATVRIPLDRTGVVTGVTLLFQVPFTANSAAQALVQSSYITQFFPYSIVQNVTYTDFAGVKHINTSGIQLHLLNMFKGTKIIANAHAMEGFITSETGLNANILGTMNAATGAVVLKGADFPQYGTFFFPLYVPLAYGHDDLRGAVLAQTDRGEHYINLTFANTLYGTTGDPLTQPIQAAASGGTWTLGNTGGAVAPWSSANIVVDAYMHYIMPQAGISSQNLPMIDLGTIYEIVGSLTDSSNIVAGNNKFVNWPNNRAIVSSLSVFDNPSTTTSLGNTLNETDMTLLTLLINGNTNVRQWTPAMIRFLQRYQLGVDIPSGVYYISARNQPVTTQLYGNVQTQFTINTVNVESAIGTPYFSNQFESFYLSGTPLPGVIQG